MQRSSLIRRVLPAVLVLLACGCTTMPPSPFTSTQLRPAVFVESKGSFLARLKFPRGDQDLKMKLYCASLIGLHGEMRTLDCGDSRKEVLPFFAALSEASHGSRVARALHDGKPVKVLMLFRVEFTRRDGSEKISVVQNFGWNRAALGEDYVSAQVIFERFSDKPDLAPGKPCRAGDEHTLIVNIASDGTLNGVEAVGERSRETCKARTMTRFGYDGLIPAHANGVAVDSIYRQNFVKRGIYSAPLSPREPPARKVFPARLPAPPPRVLDTGN